MHEKMRVIYYVLLDYKVETPSPAPHIVFLIPGSRTTLRVGVWLGNLSSHAEVEVRVPSAPIVAVIKVSNRPRTSGHASIYRSHIGLKKHCVCSADQSI